MTYSTLTTQYQITLPSVVRKGLDAKPGDRIMFFESAESGTGFFVAKIPDFFSQGGSLSKYKKNFKGTYNRGDVWVGSYLDRNS
ncbi:MAG: AbrB/MazE/SpoVT family DNA-binding domain-containing protein [Candidatus Amesbacteria bacterium]|nr:AbrB/MazE/SpoVT family DNA-binding domain-containing protein [Candidatus Amesbacteria bacterium]